MKRIWSYLFGFALLILPVVSAAAQADTPAVCLIGDHPGTPESDAQTAALLVCDELRKQGISVGDPVYEAPATASAYRLVLRRLGEKIIVRLSQEKPVGTIIAERQMTLANIEDMISAAPRLVDSLVHNKPIDTTVDIKSVTDITFAQQNSLQMEAIAAAERDAQSDINKGLWFLTGCIGNVGGIIRAHSAEPTPRATRLLGKSPEYVAFYTEAYTEKSKKLQANSALGGCVAGTLAVVILIILEATSPSSSIGRLY